MTVDLGALAEFIVRAGKSAYAGDGKRVEVPQCPGFKELAHTEGEWEYRDSYSGFYSAPGREVVWFQGKPVWSMMYSGGMLAPFHGNQEFAKQTFTFLKQALLRVEVERPFRGPQAFTEGDWRYQTHNTGDITNFEGTENIFFEGNKVFRQYYIGGLIIPK